MKNYLFAFSSIILVGLFYIMNPFVGDPKAKEEAILKAVKTYLDQVHYQPQDLNDQFSEKAFDLYIDYLDGSKRFLTQEEVSKLALQRLNIDDEINNSTLILFNESNMMIEDAIKRAERIFEEVIEYDFDFTKNEVIEMDNDKRDYPIDEEDLKEHWRKSIKYDILLKLHSKLEKQEKADEDESEEVGSLEEMKSKGSIEDAISEAEGNLEKENNISAPKKDEQIEIKTVEELIEESREDVKENFENWFNRLNKLRRSDRFESYVNAIMHVYDPHSDYYNPKEKADFDIRMSGKLEGIGARLSPEGEFTKVVSIVPGGPAWKGKELEVEDLISKVKQEDEENALNIEGMRLDDVVSKIRGKKGTKVTLTVKKPDGSYKDVEIVRDVVITEDGDAKSMLLEMDGVSEKIGYIYLPSFYADFKEKDGRSSAKDIAKELEKLKAQNVDGLILDIRNNGGGSLRDVVEMAGLFVEDGPMVQVKPKKGKPYVLEDEDKSVQYDGPLIIMTNDFSVSASEILAAALQDYKRALIVGSPSTFGKGTVQRFLSLDRIRGGNDFKPLGDVKMTIQKFYRIDGTSTQLKGVESDIVLPDSYLYIKRGEKDYDYPLEWTEIDKVSYDQSTFIIDNYDELKAKSEARVNEDEEFKLILENAERLKKNKEDKTYPLDLESFRSKMDQKSEEAKKFKNLGKQEIEGLKIENLAVDMPYIEQDSSRIGRNEDFISRLSKDIYLEETMYIMKDLIESN